MDLMKAILLILLLNSDGIAFGEISKSINLTDQESVSSIRYPRSTVDLIRNFFQTYKHIKRLTFFLCDNSSTHLSVSIPIPFDYNRNASSEKVEWNMQSDNPKSEQKHQHRADDCLNFQQIVKYLMASGNFLIKGDGNIDATMFTTSGNHNGCMRDAERNTWWNMLNSGDFKQGVVLDLRCHQSRFILQQVNNNPAIKIISHKLFMHSNGTLSLATSTTHFTHQLKSFTQTRIGDIDIVVLAFAEIVAIVVKI